MKIQRTSVFCFPKYMFRLVDFSNRHTFAKSVYAYGIRNVNCNKITFTLIETVSQTNRKAKQTNCMFTELKKYSQFPV